VPGLFAAGRRLTCNPIATGPDRYYQPS
jgi:hypothetical protein